MLRKPFLSEEIYQLARSLTISWGRDRELQQQKEYLNNITNSVGDALIVLALSGEVEWANPAAATLWETNIATDLVGRTLENLWGEQRVNSQILSLLKRRSSDDKATKIDNIEQEINLASGSHKLVLVSGTTMTVDDQVNQVILIVRDITSFRQAERQREILEEQLYSVQKMSGLGSLAGGIAHDFNNVLTPIIARATKWERKLESDHPHYTEFNEILKAANRAHGLVAQINNFSRQKTDKRCLISVASVVEEVEKLLTATIPATIQLKSEVASDLPLVMADNNQIYQVVLNLVVNGWHAVEGRSQGVLTILLRQVLIDDDSTLRQSYPQLSESKYLQLTVKDNGMGMDQSTLESIFKPFFTTKEDGKGTGVGLSVVQGIIANHDGEIIVESEVEVGSSFHIYLPIPEST